MWCEYRIHRLRNVSERKILATPSNNYISVFAKMQFFKIWVICFSVGFAFFLQPTFVSRLSTDLHQIRHECVVLLAIYTEERDFRKVQKPGHDGQNTSKNRSFFQPGRHVFACSDETVKAFCKIFPAMTSRVLYLSENVIVTVQNRPVFSITRLNGAYKNTDFDDEYLENAKSYG